MVRTDGKAFWLLLPTLTYVFIRVGGFALKWRGALISGDLPQKASDGFKGSGSVWSSHLEEGDAGQAGV
jgi:hypothetical protein